MSQEAIKQFVFNTALVVMAICVVLTLIENGLFYGLLAIPFVLLVSLALTFVQVTPVTENRSTLE